MARFVQRQPSVGLTAAAHRCRRCTDADALGELRGRPQTAAASCSCPRCRPPPPLAPPVSTQS